MVVLMQFRESEKRIQRVIERLVSMGVDIYSSTGHCHMVAGAMGAPAVGYRLS